MVGNFMIVIVLGSVFLDIEEEGSGFSKVNRESLGLVFFFSRARIFAVRRSPIALSGLLNSKFELLLVISIGLASLISLGGYYYCYYYYNRYYLALASRLMFSSEKRSLLTNRIIRCALTLTSALISVFLIRFRYCLFSRLCIY